MTADFPTAQDKLTKMLQLHTPDDPDQQSVARLAQRVEALQEEVSLARLDPVAVQKKLSQLHRLEIPGLAVQCFSGALLRFACDRPQIVPGCISPASAPGGRYVAALRIARLDQSFAYHPASFKFGKSKPTEVGKVALQVQSRGRVLGEQELLFEEIPLNEWKLYLVRFVHQSPLGVEVFLLRVPTGCLAVDVALFCREGKAL